jgi:hypothetical protein
MRAPTSRANATVARRTAWRLASPSTPVTMPRQRFRKSGRISATYSSDVKPAPASSTATSAPRAIHGRSRSRSTAMFWTASCSVSSITSREGSRSATVAKTPWPIRSGETLTNSSRPVGRRAGLGHGGPAGGLEVAAQARAGGSGERDVRRQRDEAGRRREAGEALVADRLEVRQPHDRLEDRADRAGLEQSRESVGRGLSAFGVPAGGRLRLTHLRGIDPRHARFLSSVARSGRRCDAQRGASVRLAATTRRPAPGERWKRGTPSMIRSMSSRSRTSSRSRAVAS